VTTITPRALVKNREMPSRCQVDRHCKLTLRPPKSVCSAHESMHILRMRTNVEIDNELMETALRESGLRTKRAAVEEGLRALIERQRRDGRRRRNYPL
jgi:hypothetical protein